MKILANTRIKNKIIIIIFIVGAVSSITGSVFNFVYEVRKSKSEIISNTLLHAKLLSEYCGLPMEFNFADNATEVLAKLYIIPDIYDGVLYTLNDSVFATYHKSNNIVYPIPDEIKHAPYFIEGDFIHVSYPVVYKGKTYGTLVLRSFINWKDIARQQFFVTLFVIVIILIALFIFANVLHRSISTPIVKLTDKMNFVAKNNDYSVQLEESSTDEIGELYSGFNYMLNEIRTKELNIILAKEKIEESEEKHRFLFENTIQGVVYQNTKDEIIYANKAAERILGLTFDQMSGLSSINPHGKAIHEDGTPFKQEDHPSALSLATRQPVYNNIMGIFIPEDNRYIWINVNSFPKFQINERKPYQVVVTFEDITEIRNKTEELKIAKEKAEESDRLKSAFLANMSHEIRTPMNGILGFTDLLKRKDLTEAAQKKYIAVIEHSGQRMLRLITDLLDISKIEVGQVEIKTEQTNLNELMDKIYDFFKPQAEKKGLDLTHKKNMSNLDSIIMADSIKLEQILTNLVNNALKFTSNGKINFGYELRDNNLLFWIKDTGKGIRPEMRKLIFERFRQADDSPLRGEEGSGLGLAICKAYIELMKGNIWVESEPNKGSEFWFSLPYHKSLEEKNTKNQVNEPQNNYKGVSVLIAEDDDTSYLYLFEILMHFQMNIIRANNGQEAIKLFVENPDIELVLMDIKMPVMNGLDATLEIRKSSPGIPIIAQTAYASDMDRQKALDVGCNDFITKPINKNELWIKINNILK